MFSKIRAFFSKNEKKNYKINKIDKFENIIARPDGQYMSPEEIVEDIIQNRLLKHEDLAMAKNGFRIEQTEEDKKMAAVTGLNLDGYASSAFGRWIRNAYGLWHENNPYVVLNPEPVRGIIDHPQFPDNLSHHIMKRVTEKLNG